MSQNKVQITTPAGNIVRLSDSTNNKVTTSGNIVKIVAVGTQGPAGAGDLNFVHTQSTAGAIWQVTHNLGKYPSVSVVDTSETEVVGKVIYKDWDTGNTSTTKLQILFTAAFAGKAFLN
tara:strand:+ start:306 stop:662 length:357 start_codon:yes stop_codon:yes gene_type:complete